MSYVIYLPRWTRRAWLFNTTRTALSAVAGTPLLRGRAPRVARHTPRRVPQISTPNAERLDPTPWQALALRALDAARSAGAQYADVRLQRTVTHNYQFSDTGLTNDWERIGVGVRTLANGCWGFSACPRVDADTVVRLAQDAVASAKESAGGQARVVDLGTYPKAVGSWTTPVAIDPFTVSIEEKRDYIEYWMMCAQRAGRPIDQSSSSLGFVRREQVVATSEGSLFTQTCFESGGRINQGDTSVEVQLDGLEATGRGWELLTQEAHILEQLDRGRERYLAEQALIKAARPGSVGRYTVVIDGTTMATILDRTVGVATQLDRALLYEASAGGSSFLTNPLEMLGHFQMASPDVTVMANRSAPAQLATVQWDDEGVRPEPFAIIKDGILTDFQTTREQAAWLAPYYQQHGLPVRSHGCASAPEALSVTMQQPPNLAVLPGKTDVGLEELAANVQDGILVTAGLVGADYQATTGTLTGKMRQIRNGKIGRLVVGGAVLFKTLELWKGITALGGVSTQETLGLPALFTVFNFARSHWPDMKGEPVQWTSHSVSGVAALIPNQALINPRMKA